tara:strand:+ start:179 stop:421 length:243 start_codon:yes stop_codon:yes gene_type:complete
MTPEEIMEVLQWARDNNVIRIKVGEVEAEFAPAAMSPESSDAELQRFINSTIDSAVLGDGQKKDEAQEQKEQDEMMYYSS